MKAKVAIVILNWNGIDFLKKFLPGVVVNSQLPNVEVWVADNGSTDESLSYVKNELPEVKIFENDKNEGFAGGYNTALKNIKAELYVLLNSDVEVTQGWLQPMIELFDNNDKVAAAQPKILSESNKSSFEYAGAAGGYLDKYGYPFCRGRIFDELENDHAQYDNDIDVFWATGACLFIRSNVWHEMDGLDHDFFAHMEEIDLCWRIQRAGHQIKCCPKSSVYHVGGGTLSKTNPRKTYLNFRNNLFMLLKNLPPEKVLFIMVIRWFLDGIAWLMYLITFKFSHVFAVSKAHIHFIRDYSKFNAKRKQLKQLGYPKLKTIFRQSILMQFFAKGKKKFSDLKWIPNSQV